MDNLKIIDLSDENKTDYFLCLEDWSSEMREAGNKKEYWFNKMKNKGLRIKIAKDNNGTITGMIQYMPIEHSFAQGKDLYFILCIWVHGHKQGRGDFQKKGIGKALLKASEEDARVHGAKGMAAWGLALPFWMKASWFKKQGYKKVDRQGLQTLVWKPFMDEVNPPKWLTQKKTPNGIPGKVTVTAFVNGWCPGQNIVYERAKRAVQEFGDKVVFIEIDTSDRDIMVEWGISDGLFINNKQIGSGPPVPYEKIKKLIAKQVKKLKR